MNTRAALQAAIVATPGMTLREVAAAVGQTSRQNVTGIAAQLSQLCKIGKLRKDSILVAGAQPRYWPTQDTGKDLRAARAKPPPAAPRARDSNQKQNSPHFARPAHVLRTARPKPTAAQQFRIHPRTPPRTPRPSGARHPETVDEFIARGGKVQRLDPHAASKPLRFDHRNPCTPIGRRRAVVVHRKPGAT